MCGLFDILVLSVVVESGCFFSIISKSKVDILADFNEGANSGTIMEWSGIISITSAEQNSS